jgi:hypothetical protein
MQEAVTLTKREVLSIQNKVAALHAAIDQLLVMSANGAKPKAVTKRSKRVRATQPPTGPMIGKNEVA